MKSVSAGIRNLFILAVALPLAGACAADADAPPATADAETAAAANVALVEQAVDAMWNQHDASAAMNLYAADHEGYTNGVRDTISAEAFLQSSLQEWPDSRITVDEVFAAGEDRVVMRWVFHATHAVTGTAVSVPGISISEIRDGKVARTWDSYDVMPFAVGAGATVTPPPAPAAPTQQ